MYYISFLISVFRFTYSFKKYTYVYLFLEDPPRLSFLKVLPRYKEESEAMRCAVSLEGRE